MHELRHRLLPRGMPARQLDTGVERPRAPRTLCRGERSAAHDQQLPRVHRPALPGAVRRLLCPRACLRACPHQTGRARDSRVGGGHRCARAWAGAPAHRQEGGRRGFGPGGSCRCPAAHPAGHEVVVFERAERIGGLLRYGIPEFKLEKSVLDRRLAQMSAEGTKFRTRVHIGGPVTPATAGLPGATASDAAVISATELRRSFDAVVLAAGSTRPRDLAVPGRELKGVHFAMDYLKAANLVCEGALESSPIDARGQEGRHRRRWRHRRRLPRHGPPAGRGLRLPSWRSCPCPARPGPRTTRGPPGR